MFLNTAKTAILLAALGGLIIAVAGAVGGGSSVAFTIGLGIAFVTVGASYWFSDKLALKAGKAQPITRDQAPEFFDMVARLAERANLPMPTVAISPQSQPNAFATGRNPSNAVVCATEGLLTSLTPEEVEGVMAHELMHVKHRDILIGSVAAAVAMAISYMAQMAMFSSMFGGRSRRQGNPLLLLALSILAPIAASLIQMAVSRSREFEADRGAAALVGSGAPLASALAKIETVAHQRPMPVNPAQASHYIHNPLAEARSSRGEGGGMAKLFSTHPPTQERIRRLQQM